ncbi:hypothetical protein [Streptomyces sp. NPDC056480]|uniref:hypothetical protein n=1 Tax=Streptomyces sp. NPDC056480 TaxID=3345833 RepID=UPI003683D7C4
MARDLLPNPENNTTAIAKMLGVSPGTLYNRVPDLRGLRAGGIPHQLEGAERCSRARRAEDRLRER